MRISNERLSPANRLSNLHLRMLGFVGALVLGASAHVWGANTSFTVTFDESITDSFTGRVYLMTGRGEEGSEPRFGPNWFGPAPFFAKDVVDWKPGQPLWFDDSAIAFPAPLSKIEPGTYRVQAVMRRNMDSPEIGGGDGNAYSPPTIVKVVDGSEHEPIELLINKVHSVKPYESTDRTKIVEIDSPMLTKFRGRPAKLRASVVLPMDYDKHPERRYPALYWIGGFGSDHAVGRRQVAGWDATGHGDAIVRIALDAQCYGGHHVFADSANNGPVGTSLVKELIPHLEKEFRLVPEPTARFVSGHSSGGWSSLWLQVAYPDFFGGVFSIAPDPIDFRDFQQIDLYQEGANMYRDQAGERRPIARMGTKPVLWYEDFCRMEIPYGEGGQIRSFEWVFSPRGNDGLPVKLYDRETGTVDAQVAQAWKKYDIRLIIEDNWEEIGSKLAGKLHVYTGELDTFYLEGPVERLKESMEKLGSDAVVVVEPGKDHGTIASRELSQRIDDRLMELFSKHHPDQVKE